MGCAALSIREVAETPYGSHHRSSSPAASTDPPAAPSRGQTDVTGALDPDAIEELGDEIATLSAHIHAATQRLLVLVAEFDRLRGWELSGYSNCAHWLAVRTGIDRGAAREKVRAARALTELPLISAAMARGELSFSQVRALTRVAREENEAELLELARGTTTAQLERMMRAWRKGSRQDEAAWERERYRSRTFSVFPDDDGMYIVTGRLTPEVGALLMRAIEAASDALFRERALPVATDDRDTETKAKQRRADAVGLLAERALAAGLGRAEGGREAGGAEGGAAAGGAECVREAGKITISGTRAERYQVMLHVEPESLRVDGEPGLSELEDGTRVSQETSRRLTCDASVVRVSHARDGSILEVGRNY